MYKPGDGYCKEFVTSDPATGAARDADSLPAATANRNGADDGAFALAVARLDTGRYKVTGTIPSGYASGDVVNVSVAATVNAVAGKAVIDTFVLDGKRVSDLHDAAALTDYQQRGVAVTLPGTAPAGFLAAASFAAASLNGKGDWLTPSGYTPPPPVTVDGSGRVTLAPAGLDAVSAAAPAGVAGNFREMLVQLWRRFFKHVRKDGSTVKTYADDNVTVVTTQNYTSSGGTDDLGAAS